MSRARQNGRICSARALRILQEKNAFVKNFLKWATIRDAILACGNRTEQVTCLAQKLGIILPANMTMNFEDLYKRFNHAIKHLLSDIGNLLHDFIPSDWQKKLSVNHAIRQCGNALEIFKTWQRIQSKAPTLSQVEFEIVRTLELAFQYFNINIQHPEFGNRMPQEKMAIYSFLRTNGIITSDPRSTEIQISFDQDDDNRCVAIDPYQKIDKSNPHKRLVVPLIQLATDPPIEAFLYIRRKTHQRVISKMFCKDVTDPQQITDRYGIRFSYPNEKDMGKAIEFLKANIISTGGNIRDVVVDNKYASNRLKINTIYARLAGHRREIQNMPAKDHFDIIFSHGPENHFRYHRRWYTDKNGYFDQLFPYCFYDINWSRNAVREQLDEHIIALARP